MNERIKLPAQEWLGYDPVKGDMHGYTVDQMKEFVKLIVQECMYNIVNEGNKIAKSIPNADTSNYTKVAEQVGMINAAWIYSDKIKEHFGVK